MLIARVLRDRVEEEGDAEVRVLDEARAACGRWRAMMS